MDTPDLPEGKIRVDKLIIGRMRQYEEGDGVRVKFIRIGKNLTGVVLAGITYYRAQAL